MTISTIEYALIAGASYRSTRDDINRIPYPAGWQPVKSGLDWKVGTDGFEARSFIKGTDIVISYAGTYASDFKGDILADGALGAGITHSQLLQAAQYYMDVKKANSSSKITFTGHSLGGGLAALMSMFFNLTASTFDVAPFQLSANSNTATDVFKYLKQKGYTIDAALQAVALSTSDLAQTTDWQSAQLALKTPVIAYRATNITNISAAGEFLSSVFPLSAAQIPGIHTSTINHGAQNSPFFDALQTASALHSQALLIAIYYNKTFRELTNAIPFLESIIFDENLYARSTAPSSKEADFLNHLIRYEFGIPGTANAQVNLLTKFSQDIVKLNTSTLTKKPDLQKALIVAAMEYYYFKDPAKTTKLFTLANGSINFKYSDIGASSYKSLPLLAMVVQDNASAVTDQGASNHFNPALFYIGDAPYQDLIAQDSWFIPVTDAAVTTTGTNGNDVIIGGAFADNLKGGVGKDILIGNAGADMLDGGTGADILVGGAGADTYIVDDANDKIIETLGTDVDLVRSSVSFVLGDNIENLTLTGTDAINTTGNALNNILTGNSANNVLGGGAGNDSLVGGAGNDMLIGGTGYDTYIISGNDTVIDRDGKINISGIIASGGKQMEKKSLTYRSSDGSLIYVRTGNGLRVLQAGAKNSVNIQNWSQGNLGIFLEDIKDDSKDDPNKPPIDSIRVYFQNSENIATSPLVLDLNGDGVKTVGLNANIYFDHDNNGFAELTGWADPNDGLLVLDKNGNGKIDNGTELFGNNTFLINGKKAANGFEALGSFDFNDDQKINSSDAIFNQLKIWQDKNSNGKVDDNELLTLSQVNIKSLKCELRAEI